MFLGVCLDAKVASFWLCCSASVRVSPPLRTLQRQASLRTLDEIFQEFGGEVPIIRGWLIFPPRLFSKTEQPTWSLATRGVAKRGTWD